MTQEQLNKGQELLDKIRNIEHEIKAMADMESIYITGGSGNASMGVSLKLNEDTEDSIAATEFVAKYRTHLNNKLKKLQDQFAQM